MGSAITGGSVAGGGGGGGSPSSVNVLTLSANQTTNLAIGDPIRFNTVAGDLVVTTFQFVVPANQEALLVADPGCLFSGSTGIILYRWYDVTNATLIGSEGIDQPPSRSSNSSAKNMARARVKPSIDTTYELQFTVSTLLTNITATRSSATVQFTGSA